MKTYNGFIVKLLGIELFVVSMFFADGENCIAPFFAMVGLFMFILGKD